METLKQYEVIYTSYSYQQIKEKYNYICYKFKSKPTAIKWYDSLCEEIEKSLSVLPYKYPKYKEYAGKEIRRLVTKNDVVLYYVDEEQSLSMVIACVTKGMELGEVPLILREPINEEDNIITFK